MAARRAAEAEIRRGRRLANAGIDPGRSLASRGLVPFLDPAAALESAPAPTALAQPHRQGRCRGRSDSILNRGGVRVGTADF
jgi:hypothetical protein